MAAEGSVAPKERVNIVYKAATGGAVEEKELPLKLLMLGDWSGRENSTPLEERKPVGIDKNNFDDVLANQRIRMEFAVPNRLDPSAGELPVTIGIGGLKDFGPEQVARQVPELRKLLELREALSALKGPLGNIPAFRKKIQEIVSDEKARSALLAELGQG